MLRSILHASDHGANDAQDRDPTATLVSDTSDQRAADSSRRVTHAVQLVAAHRQTPPPGLVAAHRQTPPRGPIAPLHRHRHDPMRDQEGPRTRVMECRFNGFEGPDDQLHAESRHRPHRAHTLLSGGRERRMLKDRKKGLDKKKTINVQNACHRRSTVR